MQVVLDENDDSDDGLDLDQNINTIFFRALITHRVRGHSFVRLFKRDSREPLRYFVLDTTVC